MTALEFAAIMLFVPALVFFVFRSGFGTGAARMLESLHDQGYLTREAVKEFSLDDIAEEEE